MDLPIVTGQELRRCNGKNGKPAWIAYRGKVYDVSRSFQWQNGRHWVVHGVGVDLTGSLKDAPHGEDLLERLSVVGILKGGMQ